MTGIENMIATLTGSIEVLLFSIPESVGLLIFGAGLMGGAILTRRYFRKASEADAE
jgi:hypothetical protein